MASSAEEEEEEETPPLAVQSPGIGTTSSGGNASVFLPVRDEEKEKVLEEGNVDGEKEEMWAWHWGESARERCVVCCRSCRLHCIHNLGFILPIVGKVVIIVVLGLIGGLLPETVLWASVPPWKYLLFFCIVIASFDVARFSVYISRTIVQGYITRKVRSSRSAPSFTYSPWILHYTDVLGPEIQTMLISLITLIAFACVFLDYPNTPAWTAGYQYTTQTLGVIAIFCLGRIITQYLAEYISQYFIKNTISDRFRATLFQEIVLVVLAPGNPYPSSRAMLLGRHIWSDLKQDPLVLVSIAKYILNYGVWFRVPEFFNRTVQDASQELELKDEQDALIFGSGIFYNLACVEEEIQYPGHHQEDRHGGLHREESRRGRSSDRRGRAPSDENRIERNDSRRGLSSERRGRAPSDDQRVERGLFPSNAFLSGENIIASAIKMNRRFGKRSEGPLKVRPVADMLATEAQKNLFNIGGHEEITDNDVPIRPLTTDGSVLSSSATVSSDRPRRFPSLRGLDTSSRNLFGGSQKIQQKTGFMYPAKRVKQISRAAFDKVLSSRERELGITVDHQLAWEVVDQTSRGFLTQSGLRTAASTFVLKRNNIRATLRDTTNVIKKLSWVIFSVVNVFVLLSSVAVFGIDANGFWVTLSSILVTGTVFFGQALLMIANSIVFLFIRHPYGVGDVLHLSESLMGTATYYYVKRIELTVTELSRWDNASVRLYNTYLSDSVYIVNYNRSGLYWQYLLGEVDAEIITEESIEKARKYLDVFVAAHPQRYSGKHQICCVGLGAPFKIQVAWYVEFAYQNIDLRQTFEDIGRAYTAFAQAMVHADFRYTGVGVASVPGAKIDAGIWNDIQESVKGALNQMGREKFE